MGEQRGARRLEKVDCDVAVVICIIAMVKKKSKLLDFEQAPLAPMLRNVVPCCAHCFLNPLTGRTGSTRFFYWFERFQHKSLKLRQFYVGRCCISRVSKRSNRRAVSFRLPSSGGAPAECNVCTGIKRQSVGCVWGPGRSGAVGLTSSLNRVGKRYGVRRLLTRVVPVIPVTIRYRHQILGFVVGVGCALMAATPGTSALRPPGEWHLHLTQPRARIAIYAERSAVLFN